MKLLIEDEKGLLDAKTVALLRRCADAAAQTEGLRVPVAAFVSIVDDARIREVNREQRGIDRATDVLSFPAANYPKGRTAQDCEALLRRQYDPDADACMLGDILLSIDHVRAQAREYGHSERREAGYLLTHGLFHLMGYDHMNEEEKTRMREMEERSLVSIGLAREGGEPMTDRELMEMAIAAREFAYAPYSGYRVGAALESEDGLVFTGCNIENAAYGNTICAERTALGKAVSEGARRFTRLAIASSGSAPYPCGACRQSLYEFAPKLRILVTWDGRAEEALLCDLLPEGFGPMSLGKDNAQRGAKK